MVTGQRYGFISILIIVILCILVPTSWDIVIQINCKLIAVIFSNQIHRLQIWIRWRFSVISNIRHWSWPVAASRLFLAAASRGRREFVLHTLEHCTILCCSVFLIDVNYDTRRILKQLFLFIISTKHLNQLKSVSNILILASLIWFQLVEMHDGIIVT